MSGLAQLQRVLGMYIQQTTERRQVLLSTWKACRACDPAASGWHGK